MDRKKLKSDLKKEKKRATRSQMDNGAGDSSSAVESSHGGASASTVYNLSSQN